MSAKSEHFVSYSLEELVAMERRGEVKTDWERAAQHSIPDGSDPDDAMEPFEDWQVTMELPPVFRPANVRVDEDVLSWFRAQDQAYEAKINDVLRSYREENAR